jgi:hypothetical protein
LQLQLRERERERGVRELPAFLTAGELTISMAKAQHRKLNANTWYTSGFCAA